LVDHMTQPTAHCDPTLQAVLHPHSVNSLLKSCWDTKPLLIKGGLDKFDHLGVSRETFSQSVSLAPRGKVLVCEVGADSVPTYRVIDAHDAENCFANGMTVCIHDIDRLVPALRHLSVNTRQALSLAGAVHCNSYLSPLGKGFGLHFDTQSVFLIQISGSKHWEYGERPALEHPTETAEGWPPDRLEGYRHRHPWAHIEAPENSDWQDCELLAGDVLYLPPGTWHQGHAGEHSLGVTLTCPPVSFSTLLLEVAFRRLFTSYHWRQSLPASTETNGVTGLPSTVEPFIESRLEELKDFVASLTPAEFADRWSNG
jgi:ribosomal protein L16 Arg81 hydroxylase